MTGQASRRTGPAGLIRAGLAAAVAPNRSMGNAVKLTELVGLAAELHRKLACRTNDPGSGLVSHGLDGNHLENRL